MRGFSPERPGQMAEERRGDQERWPPQDRGGEDDSAPRDLAHGDGGWRRVHLHCGHWWDQCQAHRTRYTNLSSSGLWLCNTTWLQQSCKYCLIYWLCSLSAIKNLQSSSLCICNTARLLISRKCCLMFRPLLCFCYHKSDVNFWLLPLQYSMASVLLEYCLMFWLLLCFCYHKSDVNCLCNTKCLLFSCKCCLMLCFCYHKSDVNFWLLPLQYSMASVLLEYCLMFWLWLLFCFHENVIFWPLPLRHNVASVLLRIWLLYPSNVIY